MNREGSGGVKWKRGVMASIWVLGLCRRKARQRAPATLLTDMRLKLPQARSAHIFSQ